MVFEEKKLGIAMALLYNTFRHSLGLGTENWSKHYESSSLASALRGCLLDRPMKKADLAAMLQDELETTKAQAERLVQMFWDAIADSLSKGEDVDIAGFGKFVVNKRAARTARNPRTGETVQVPATKVPKFKASKALKDAVK